MIDIVSATRADAQSFGSETALGQSLRRLAYDGRLRPRIAFENRRGLPEVYNAAIESADSADILVCVHDDVWLDDCFLFERVTEALRVFDVVGVAGNRRCPPDHVGWGFLSEPYQWDDLPNLSGIVAHGASPCGAVSCFGAVPAECELLDGVFLAVNRRALVECQVEFDPQFDFHFYDLDFCRSARRSGLRLGTWPVALTHQSGGAYGSDAWRRLCEVYQNKWR